MDTVVGFNGGAISWTGETLGEVLGVLDLESFSFYEIISLSIRTVACHDVIQIVSLRTLLP